MFRDNLNRAGRWLLHSGIQDISGGVARYYRSDLRRNNPVSTEITGYAASTLVYLHSLTGEEDYLEAAARAGRFLSRQWDRRWSAIPFEASLNGSGPLAFFFDSGIIVRGLLAVWRATRDQELLHVARACGEAMMRDFDAGRGEWHPILSLPGKEPLPRTEHWSRSTGCYHLKSAMAWHDLYGATGEERFRNAYACTVDAALRNEPAFLPGHPEPDGVMDRLHPFCYFLEGLLPCAGEERRREVFARGIARVATYLREIAPSFVRSDVYAQLLRVRLFADSLGLVPLDREAASHEATELAGFQCAGPDPRIDGGFYFGRRQGSFLPHVNPVSAGFGIQALTMWGRHLAGEAAPELWLLV